MSQHTPWELIARYLAGECDPGEIQAMERWLEEADNRLLFEEIRRAWLDQQPEQQDFDPEKGIARLHQKIAEASEEAHFEIERSSFRSIHKMSWLVAACIALVIGLGYLFLNPTQNLKKVRVAKLEKRSGKDEVIHFYLPDSSEVWLNKNSAMTYPQTFAGDLREVALQGEAFFKVVRNPEKPFIVQSGGVSTQVLGTSFDVKAYPGERLASVTVATGLVEVSNMDAAGKVLGKTKVNPMQQVTVDIQNQQTYTSSVRRNDIAGWRQEPLIFRDNTYAQVAAALEERFETKIIMTDNQLKNCRVMAHFNRGASLEEILKLLSMSNSFQYSLAKDQVTIRGGYCQ